MSTDSSTDPSPGESPEVSVGQGPEVSRKVSPEASADQSPEVSTGQSPEVSPDESPEASADVSPEASADEGPEELLTPCPTCGEAVHTGDAFCEACGSPLLVPATTPLPPAPAVAPAPSAVSGAASEPPAPAPRACHLCGGAIAPDGYCEQCGQPAPSERDHWAETPHPAVAGVCDRGIRHAVNEDAMAITAAPRPDGGLGVALLVVCDGVSSTPDSDVASLAAARAALVVLEEGRLADQGASSDPSAVVARWSERLRAAGVRASDAIDEVIHDNLTRANPPSCTFSAAVLDGSVLLTGNVGDSRSYWIPDAGVARQLTVDDSWAQQQIAAGVPRAQAETAKDAHAITRWLGADAEDEVPLVALTFLQEAGWVVVCSDGLWNYASAADAIGRVLHTEQARVGADPSTLAEALVAWANAQGGHDNITVALARFEPERGVAPVGAEELSTAPVAHAPAEVGPDGDAGAASETVSPVRRSDGVAD